MDWDCGVVGCEDRVEDEESEEGGEDARGGEEEVDCFVG